MTAMTVAIPDRPDTTIRVKPLAGFGHLPECDQPHVLAEEIFEMMRQRIEDHPRSQQTRIGPSEVGEPCTRRLAYKLAEIPEPPEVRVPWKSTVGTGMHSWQQETVEAWQAQYERLRVDPRYLLEQRVTVGTIAGTPITGSCDLFDQQAGAVWDWKFIGKTRMKHYKVHGPSDVYRIQGPLYGRGFQAEGHKVNTAGIIFFPRDGELHESFVWAQPYDEQVAIKALDRCTEIVGLINVFGIEAVVTMFPPCTDDWCPWCQTRTPWGQPQPMPKSLREMIAQSR